MDVCLDGKLRATNHDVWGTYLPLIKNCKKFLNGDITVAEAEALVEKGVGDVIVFGRYISFALTVQYNSRPWIINPDFGTRVLNDLPVVTEYDFTVSSLRKSD